MEHSEILKTVDQIETEHCELSIGEQMHIIEMLENGNTKADCLAYLKGEL